MPAPDSHAPAAPADTPNAATPVPPHGTWSGRFGEPMSERMQRFNASVDFDRRLARADIATEVRDPGKPRAWQQRRNAEHTCVRARNRPVGVLSAKRIVRYLVEHFPGLVYNQPPDPDHLCPPTAEGA